MSESLGSLPGSGSCSMIPETASSAGSPRITSAMSSLLALASRRACGSRVPASTARRRLLRAHLAGRMFRQHNCK